MSRDRGMRFPQGSSKTVAAAATLLLSLAGVAWACTPQAWVTAAPDEGPVGSEVMVTGGQFLPAPVEIRWNSVNGPVLAVVEGPSFSVPVTIPQASPGVNYIVGVTGVYSAKNVFTVTAPVGSQPGAAGGVSGGGANGEVSGGSRRAGSPDVADDGAEDGAGSTAPSASTGTAPAQPGSGRAGSSRGSAPEGEVIAAPSRSSVGSAPRSSATSRSSSTISSARRGQDSGRPLGVAVPPHVVRTQDGEAVFAGSLPSLATGGNNGAGDRVEQRTSAAVIADIPPEASAGDLWGGFDASAPSRVPGLGASVAGGGNSSQSALGVVLLSAGLVALFAGFIAADARRRKARAHG